MPLGPSDDSSTGSTMFTCSARWNARRSFRANSPAAARPGTADPRGGTSGIQRSLDSAPWAPTRPRIVTRHAKPLLESLTDGPVQPDRAHAYQPGTTEACAVRSSGLPHTCRLAATPSEEAPGLGSPGHDDSQIRSSWETTRLTHPPRLGQLALPAMQTPLHCARCCDRLVFGSPNDLRDGASRTATRPHNSL